MLSPLSVLVLSAAQAQAPLAEVRPFLDAHCVRCHGAESPKGDLRLDAEAVGAQPFAAWTQGAGASDADLDAWDWLAEQVEFGDMPPAGEPGPDDAARAAFVARVRHELGRAADARGPAPLPWSGLRRLTRPEYEHAIRDLFGVSVRADRHLPEDAVGHGFDHVADAQSLSEADFVRYLEAAEYVADRVVGVRADPERRIQIDLDAISGQGRHTGAVWRWSNGTAWATVPLPRGGEYLVRANTFGTQGGPDPVRVQLEFEGGKRSARLDVPFERDAPGDVEARIVAPRGGDVRVGVRFVNDYYREATDDRPKEDRNLAIRWMEVVGPLDEAPPAPFVTAMVGDDPRASGKAVERALRAGLLPVVQRVWREPDLGKRDLAPLLDLSRPSDPAEERLRLALTAALASPRFLFRAEEGKGSVDRRGARALTSTEAATRLAAFLWQTVPDAELLARAERQNLARADHAVACAEDMLRDPRARAFVRSFGEQWLQLRGIERVRPDGDRFPGFDRGLARAMAEETGRVLEDSLAHDRSLWDLVDGDTTFVNERLAAHYGLDFPSDTAEAGWARVSLGETPRRGLLGHGSVLLRTSEAKRTSPVLRGRWVLDVLLGSAPPPPPPGVDSIDESKVTDALSFREQLELHRAKPECAACHSRMDPIGFGLESFDAVGALRDAQDTSGVLPDGRSFDGPLELIAILRGDERFLEAFVERLATYALGRGLERADRPFVEEILADLDPDHPTFRAAILGIVASDTFLRVRVR